MAVQTAFPAADASGSAAAPSTEDAHVRAVVATVRAAERLAADPVKVQADFRKARAEIVRLLDAWTEHVDTGVRAMLDENGIAPGALDQLIPTLRLQLANAE